MSEHVGLVEDAVSRLLESAEERCPPTDNDAAFHDLVWNEFVTAGLPRVMAPESQGGSGTGFDVAAVVARLAGRHALSLPIAETMLANRLAAEAGLEVGDARTALAISTDAKTLHIAASGGKLRLSGFCDHVAWAGETEAVLVAGLCEDGPVLMRVGRPSRFVATSCRNVAGEARDRLAFDELTLEPSDWKAMPTPPQEILAQAALLRAAQSIGAMETAFALTRDYAGERNQFGRPLAKFQVVQHQIAAMAGQIAACKAAVMAGEKAADEGADILLMAIAKARTGEASAMVAAIAHQVHGAIGFTQEYRLHRATRRLWAWRDDYGTESFWQEWIGGHMLTNPAGPSIWKSITRAA